MNKGLQGLLIIIGTITGAFFAAKLAERYTTKVVVYDCPNCGHDVEYNEEKCPNCKTKLIWNF